MRRVPWFTYRLCLHFQNRVQQVDFFLVEVCFGCVMFTVCHNIVLGAENANFWVSATFTY